MDHAIICATAVFVVFVGLLVYSSAHEVSSREEFMIECINAYDPQDCAVAWKVR